MEKYTGSTSHSDRATKGKNKGRIMVNIKENHRDKEEIQKLNSYAQLEGREPKYNLELAKQNIDIIRPDELTIESCYEKVFGESIERFNSTQKRKDRMQSVEKILNKIESANVQQDPLQAMVVQVGTMENHPSKEVLVPLYYDYLEKFQERFSNMKVVSAAIHLDEATPHLQFYYVPVKYKEKCSEEVQKKWRGIDMQPSMTGALEQMGYSNEATKTVVLEDGTTKEMKDYKQGALAQFQKDFNGLLDEVCKNYDIEIDHYMRGQKVQHQDTKTKEELKKEKDLVEKNELLQKEISVLQDKQNHLQDKIDALETEKIYMEETIDSLKKEKSGLEKQVAIFKEKVSQVVEHFENLLKKVEGRIWGDLFKQRKAEAAIRTGKKEQDTVEGYLKENDLQSEIPIDSLGRFIGATSKLEELDEEWERE